jgi:hypothetical protein
MGALATGAAGSPTYDYDLRATADGVTVVPYHGTVEHLPGVTQG